MHIDDNLLCDSLTQSIFHNKLEYNFIMKLIFTYLSFRSFNFVFSSLFIKLSPADSCSDFDSLVKCPSSASLPAKSGCNRKIFNFAVI